MSNFTATKDSTKLWNASIDPGISAKTLTIPTASTYLDRNIEITINRPSTETAKAILGEGEISIEIDELSSNNTIYFSDEDVSGVVLSEFATYNVEKEGWISENDTGIVSQTKYVSGVKINPPSSGTRTFSITVPDKATDDTLTFVFTVDSNRNVYVVEQQ